MEDSRRSVLVTGGAGYVGSALVPRLLERGHQVTVLDLFLYGSDVLAACSGTPGLRIVEGDIRDEFSVTTALDGCDSVIHLACISNDPSFELDPMLGRSINLDAFRPLVRAARESGVDRFIYASSSSVYGVKDEDQVTEDLALEPLTDYSRYKAECESILADERRGGFVTLTARPATVCGPSPRQRLDVIVNILVNHAVNRGEITVLGGDQTRPNIHVQDMCDFYLSSLDWSDDEIDGRIYNVGDENYTVEELAQMVQLAVGSHVTIRREPTNDPRSYRISSAAIATDLGFTPSRSITRAIDDLVAAFRAGMLPGSMSDPRYFNIEQMRLVDLA